VTPRRNALSRDRVVRAALAIVDRDGLDALTMRALGRELGVDPMAVYHHLPNKAAVLDGVVEAVLAEVPLDKEPGRDWAEQTAALARGYRDVLRAHPNALPVVATRTDVTPPALAILDGAVRILLDAGFEPRRALLAVHSLSCFVVGHALDELGLAADAGEPAAAAARQRELLDSGAYPSLATAASAAGEAGPEESFDLGLAALLRGLSKIDLSEPRTKASPRR
jgi:TetR/AcrR family transcriptional regulator, tetracycline repressor protein